MTAVLEVDVTSPVPPYEQIRAQVAGHVATGRLRKGDRLPTVRALAANLGIATGTVARAYRELEAAGLVASRRRVGTVVTADTRPPDAALAEAAEAMARLAVRHGVDDGTAVDLLRGALAAARAAGHARA